MALQPPRIAALLLLAAALLAPAVLADTLATVGALPTPRSLTGAALVGPHAYVFGGASGGAHLKDIVRYELASNMATVLPAQLPTTNTRMGVASDGTHVYLLGGCCANGLLARIDRFDPASGTLTTLPATLPGGRASAAAVWTGQHVFLFGGEVGANLYTDQIVRFTPSTGAVAVMPAKLPQPLAFMAAVWDGQHAWLFGGGNTGSQEAILRYHPASDAVAVMGATLPHAHSPGAAVHDQRGRALLFGGAFNNAILRYDTASDTLAPAPLQLPFNLSHTSAVWDGQAAWLFGGHRTPANVAVAEVQRFAPDLPPTAPLALSATLQVQFAGGAAQVGTRLAWSPPQDAGSSPLLGYEVHRGVGAGAKALLATTGATTHLDTTCPAGSTCHYQVRALNAVAPGPFSNGASAMGTALPV